jgi:hypothetical protein
VIHAHHDRWPWVICPISVHAGTRDATRARRVTAAAAGAVSASPSRVATETRLAWSSEGREQVAGLLGDPGSGGWGGDRGEVDAAGAVLDYHQG